MAWGPFNAGSGGAQSGGGTAKEIAYEDTLGISASNIQEALDKVLELDSRFHTQIANAAQNPMLATITEYITRLTMPSRLETTRKVLAKGEEEIERFVELHRQLLSVIERRQVDEIAATVQDHYIFWKK